MADRKKNPTVRKTNPFGKSATQDNPYAIYEGDGPFGRTICKVLKTYQHPDNEKGNQYARWFVAVSTDFTYNRFELGDSYANEATWGLKLTYATPEWKEFYK